VSANVHDRLHIVTFSGRHSVSSGSIPNAYEVTVSIKYRLARLITFQVVNVILRFTGYHTCDVSWHFSSYTQQFNLELS
jgi:hypothetical protein